MRGQLASTLLEHMDLPKEFAQRQFADLLSQYGLKSETLTLEDLREILADYLQNTLLELKEQTSEPIQNSVRNLPTKNK